jgi:hypothetical protein
MAQYSFGVGTMIGIRTDIANQAPAYFGVLQDLSIDFDQSIKELIGQQKFAVDVAPAQLKIVGKAKYARIQSGQINNMLLGATATAASGFDMAVAENVTPSATTFTVSKGATFVADMGVFFSSSGIQLTPVTATPSAGQYIAGATTVGQYTINATDTSKLLLVYYTYTVATLNQVTINNSSMGTGPTFQLNVANSYTVLGSAKALNLRLNACRGTKFSLPFKNTDYTQMDFEFQAFADTAGVVGTLAITE